LRQYHSSLKIYILKKNFVKVSVLSLETSHITKEIWKQDNGRIEGEILLLHEFRKICGNKKNTQRQKVYVLKGPK
jgi:hypothetical protein